MDWLIRDMVVGGVDKYLASKKAKIAPDSKLQLVPYPPAQNTFERWFSDEKLLSAAFRAEGPDVEGIGREQLRQNEAVARVIVGHYHACGAVIGVNLRRFVDGLVDEFLCVGESFVGQKSRAMVEAMIRMAHALDLKVLAEGVETTEQHDVLCALGCDELQGYLLGRPAALVKI